MISNPASPKYKRIVSWSIPYDELAGEEKTRAWLTNGSAYYVEITKNVDFTTFWYNAESNQ